MRRYPRPIVVAIVLALAGTVAGCAGFDPTDMLDFLDTKKKIPGERREVFPDGVPGIEPGVPREYLRGESTDPTVPDQSAAGNQQPGAAPPPGPAASAEAPPPAVTPPKNTKVAKRRRITAIPKETSPAPADQTQQAAPPPVQQQSAFPAPLPNTFQQ